MANVLNDPFHDPMADPMQNAMFGDRGALVFPRAAAIVQNSLPTTKTSATTNNIRHTMFKYNTVGPASLSWSSFKLDYVNFQISATNEVNGDTNITVKSLIYVPATNSIFPVTFSGSSSTVITPGSSVQSDSISGLTLVGNTEFYVLTRIEGPTTSTAYVSGSPTIQQFLEGAIASTTGDYTDGSFGRGAVCTANMTGSTISSITVNSGGANYSGTVNVFAVSERSDNTVRASTVGTANLTSGVVTSINLTSNLTNWNWGAPKIYLSNQITSSGTGYAPALITAIPSSQMNTLLLVGDSITIGYTQDATGDIYRAYGTYPRAVRNRFGVMNMGVSSGRAVNAKDYTLKFPKCYALYTPYMTHALVAFGRNDMGTDGTTAANHIINMNVIASYLRGINNTKVSIATVVPFTTGTFTTLVGQTPNADWANGQDADTFNTAVRNNTIVSDWGYVDAMAFYRDQTTEPWKWRVDLVDASTGSAAAITSDGTHPNALAAGRASLDTTFKAFFNPIVTVA